MNKIEFRLGMIFAVGLRQNIPPIRFTAYANGTTGGGKLVEDVLSDVFRLLKKYVLRDIMY
jgi:hypothetical protein